MFTATLSQNAKKALALLSKSRVLPKGNYLAGGSALALHFGHRISVDFDFFTPNNFDQQELAASLSNIGSFKQSEIAKDTLLGIFNKVKFSIFRYGYPLLFPLLKFEGIQLASPKDIAAMKLAAIMDRGTKKDFIDLYFLIKKGISVDMSFEYYDRKYKTLANNLYSLITSISYFEDAEKTNLPKMLIKISWEKVKKFFEKEAVRLGRRYL